MINAFWEPLRFEIQEGRDWRVIVDTSLGRRPILLTTHGARHYNSTLLSRRSAFHSCSYTQLGCISILGVRIARGRLEVLNAEFPEDLVSGRFLGPMHPNGTIRGWHSPRLQEPSFCFTLLMRMIHLATARPPALRCMELRFRSCGNNVKPHGRASEDQLWTNGAGTGREWARAYDSSVREGYPRTGRRRRPRKNSFLRKGSGRPKQ